MSGTAEELVPCIPNASCSARLGLSHVKLCLAHSLECFPSKQFCDQPPYQLPRGSRISSLRDSIWSQPFLKEFGQRLSAQLTLLDIKNINDV